MWRVLLASLPLVLLAGSARADVPDAGDDVAAAQAELDRDLAASEASDCAVACRALESMRRAADHLCALDPGDRCADARAKVERATARVRAACPECAEAAVTMTGQAPPAPVPARPDERVAEEAAPAKRGGCAGCAVGGGEGAAAGAAGALAAVLAVLARRRRKRV